MRVPGGLLNHEGVILEGGDCSVYGLLDSYAEFPHPINIPQ